MKTILPNVSVVVACYNQQRFLEQRFASIFAQGHQPAEIVFVDDSSSDGSSAWVAERHWPIPVRIIANSARNGCPVRQWRTGIEAVRHEFVWIAEADDEAEEGFLCALLEALVAAPQAGFAFCRSRVIDGDGNVVDDSLRNSAWRGDGGRERQRILEGRRDVVRFFAAGNPIPNVSGCLFRRSAFFRTEWCDMSMVLSGDWLAYTKLLMTAPVLYVPGAWNRHRRHGGTVRERADRGWRRIEEGYRILGSILRDYPGAEEDIEPARECWFYAFLCQLAEALAGHFVPPVTLVEAAEAADPNFWGRLAAFRSGRTTGRKVIGTGQHLSSGVFEIVGAVAPGVPANTFAINENAWAFRGATSWRLDSGPFGVSLSEVNVPDETGPWAAIPAYRGVGYHRRTLRWELRRMTARSPFFRAVTRDAERWWNAYLAYRVWQITRAFRGLR